MPGPRRLLAHTASHLTPPTHPTPTANNLPTADGAAAGVPADDAAAFFRENGFVKLEDYFSPAESARMVAPVADAHDGPLSPVVNPRPPSLAERCAGL